MNFRVCNKLLLLFLLMLVDFHTAKEDFLAVSMLLWQLTEGSLMGNLLGNLLGSQTDDRTDTHTNGDEPGGP